MSNKNNFKLEDKKTELLLWITLIANFMQFLYAAIALLKFLSPKKKKH